MKITVIGSSNTYRFMEFLKEEEREAITMQKCTKIDTFKAKMDDLEKFDKSVLISVIENFVCDEVGGSNEKEVIEEGVKSILVAFVETIKVAAIRLPETRFVMVEPMERPGVKWYSEALRDLTTEYTNKIGGLQLINISVIKRESLPPQVFDKYLVHLTEDAGTKFLRAIIYYATEIFEATLVDLDKEAMDVGEVGRLVDESGPISRPATEKAKSTQEQLEEVKRAIEFRWRNDNMVMARIREELDFAANVKKEDRLIISGVTSRIPKPANEVDARKWRREIVGKALDLILPESDEKIQFVSPSRSRASDFPMCEVKFRVNDWAGKVRREFGKLRKEKKIEGRIFVANCVTQATRVRLEILRAIAKKCCSNTEDMLVMGFTSRPVLQVRRKDGGDQRVLTFVDAIERYGRRVNEGDLCLAYERAGLTFRGQMEQNFVVLTEKGVKEGVRQSGVGGASGIPVLLTGGNTANKRTFEHDNAQASSSKRQAESKGKGASTSGKK
jgi:hypothetical protein